MNIMEQDVQLHSGRTNNYNEKRTYTFTGKQLLVAILTIIALVAILWIWKTMQVNRLKKEQAERVQELKQQTKTMLANSEQYYLGLLAKPYVWAVRTEMMRGNLEQVNLYANDMVKEKNFRSISIADNKGVILSSTNKKLEGQNLTVLGNSINISTNNTVVDQVNDSLLLLASPIMGFNDRLGTLIINYTPTKPAQFFAN
jgi:hypothetical protein